MNKLNNDLVVKSNRLIEASYKLTAGEQKIIYKLTSIINKDDDDFKEYYFKINDFLKLLGIKDQSKYTEIPKITKGLMKKVFTVHDERGELQVSWLSSVRYLKGSGQVILKFDSNLKPLLLKLKKEFTKLNISNCIRLKSFYSMRIYELLKQYITIGMREFELNNLKHILGIEKDEYKLYADFKRYVLKQAQKELNKKTDIYFDFEEIKTGRKVTSIKFYIHKKSKNEIACTSEDTPDKSSIKRVQAMIDENITSLEARKILNAANNDLEKVKEKYSMAKDVNKIDNIVAWLIKAIKEDWKPQKGKVKKGTFDNFKQRNYDFDDLEKKLLGWE